MICWRFWTQTSHFSNSTGPFVVKGLVYTMNHEVGPWKMASFHDSTFTVNFFYFFIFEVEKSIHKAFGPPSLGVNQLWTKRNNRAKIERANFLIYVHKRQFQKKNWPFFCLLLSSSSLSQYTFHYKNILTIFLGHRPLCFSTIAPLLPLPPQNPLDHVSG